MLKSPKKPSLLRKIAWGNTAVGSFIFGILSVLGFFGYALLTADYTKEAMWTEPRTIIMCGIVGIGLLALIVFCISLFALLFKKTKIGAIVIAILLIIAPVSVGYFLVRAINNPAVQTNIQQAGIPTFTGQQLFDAVNVYRKANGVPELTLDDKLCNNLAQRYYDIKKGIDEGIAHKGLDEWSKKYVPNNYAITEDFAWGRTPEEVIKEWEGSPGHRLSILDPKNKLACSYASEGYGIIEVGYKVVANVSTYSGDGSRTGQIVSYHEWCNNKNISVYENELITKKSSDGKIYSMTQGDWDCYENFLKQ